MSKTINIIHGSVEKSIDFINLSDTLTLLGIVMPYEYNCLESNDDDRDFLCNCNKSLRSVSRHSYNNPVLEDSYHLLCESSSYRHRPSLCVIGSAVGDVISYSALTRAAEIVRDDGSDMLYVPCDFIPENVHEMMLPIISKLLRDSTPLFEKIYVSSRSYKVCNELKNLFSKNGNQSTSIVEAYVR